MKKNKTITTFLTLLGIIITPSFVSAQEAEIKSEVKTEVKTEVEIKTDIVRPQSIRPETRNMREEVRGEIKEIRKDGQGERQEMRKERRDQVMTIRQNASSTTQRPAGELKVLREQNKTEIAKIRADFSATIKTNRASTTEVIKEKREDLIKGIQEKRELFKEELETKKEYRASTTAAMKAKFKEGLLKIKDEKKKIRVENAAENLTELNTEITTKSSENINKIEEVLIAIESRADKATANNVNVANVRAQIALAETAIADARIAVTAQAGKTYTVTILDESTVKTSVQSTRDLLKKDIDMIRVKIKAAHDATRKAAETLKSIPKINNEIAATSTVTATTTN